MTKTQRARLWTEQAVRRTRETVAALVDDQRRLVGADGILRYMVGQVMLMSEDPAELQQLLRFCFLQTALEHHVTHGGLRPGHVSQLCDIAVEILHEHGVLSSASRLGFLYGEIIALRSRLAAKTGEAWLSVVTQQQALGMARTASGGAYGAMTLELAERVLRFGQASHALGLVAKATRRRLDGEGLARAALLRGRALRLAGQPSEALDALTGHPSREAAWERLKAEAALAGDFETLARATRRGKPHYEPGALLETTLYLRSAAKRVNHALLPKLTQLARRRNFGWDASHESHKLLRALESAYEPERAVQDRIDGLATALLASHRFASLEHEMLGWAAAARWLARVSLFDLAATALRRYVGFGLAASDGRCADPLAVAGDLLAKPWYAAAELDEEEEPAQAC